MEKYINQVEKKPVLKYTSEDILKKRRKQNDWKERVAADRAKKLIRIKDKYKLRADFKTPKMFIDEYC